MSKEFDTLKELKHWKEINTEKGVTWLPVFVVEAAEKDLIKTRELKSENNALLEENKDLYVELAFGEKQYKELTECTNQYKRVLEILKPYLRITGKYLQAKMPLVDNDSWINIKEITDEKELESLKRYFG